MGEVVGVIEEVVGGQLAPEEQMMGEVVGEWPPAKALTQAAIDSAGFRLVRRVARGGKWHPARDKLRGTEEYRHGETFSVRWDRTECDEFLFATGDLECWLWCTRRAAIGENYEGHRGAPREVLASNLDRAPHRRKWYHRARYAPDPWISLKDHWDDNRTTQIYGEAGDGKYATHTTLLRKHDGANVYVRAARGRHAPAIAPPAQAVAGGSSGCCTMM